MATPYISEKDHNREELDSLEVAEAARERKWENPSFVGEIFMGRLHTDMVVPYPQQTEADRIEGDAYLARLRTLLIEKIDPEAVDRDGDIPDTAMKALVEIGAFGMKIPKEYGGIGLSQVNYGRAMALISSHCASTAALLSAHQSIGVPQPLRLFGTEEQKRKFLPRLARGAVSAFALTEPEVGSDPARMSTTATLTADGQHYVLNGTKLWCTNGSIAELLVVMAQTPPKMVDGREKKQITAFIVESNTPGFEIAHRCRFLGMNGIQNALIKLKDVKVPKANIIGGEGQGLKLALTTLNAGRLSLPAGAIGGLRQCVKISREWGNERKQWGAPIGQHEVGADKIARMSSSLFAMEAVTWLSSIWVDHKSHDIRLEAAMAKVFCSETGHGHIEDTLQLRGGRGYERASSLKARGEKPWPVERMLRDSRINMIVEGTSEVLRLFIAREALDRHLSIAGDVLDARLSIGRRALAALKAASYYAWWYPAQWAGEYLNVASLFAPGHLGYARRTSHRLARTVFHLMVTNGPKLEKRQLQLFRAVDIATDLFAIAATSGRAEVIKEADARLLCDHFCREARARIKKRFRHIRSNNDALTRKIGRNVLAGQERWLERECV